MISIMRHATSRYNEFYENILNVPLSLKGFEQASKVFGSYDLAILSPLKRAQQTFYSSNIQAKTIVTSVLCREKKNIATDFMEDEEQIPEDDITFTKRVEAFIMELKEYSKRYKNILVVTHGIFTIALTGKDIANCEILPIHFT